MSFSKETKNDLCTLSVKGKCCKKALLYGLLISGNVFSVEKIRLVTEHERTSELILHLLKDLYSVKGNLYINEKKTKDGPMNSYKITVSSKEDLKKIFSDFAMHEEYEGAVNPEIFRCDDCFHHFLRGVFLTSGTVTDPKSAYHLELVFSSEYVANTLFELLENAGFAPKYITRKTSFVLYVKESEHIEDFLTFIGATQASLAIMNIKIYKDIRNTQNRHSNCDAANINKMTGKAQEHIRMITSLNDAGLFELLSPDLQATAALRIENPVASLAELASLHTPPITKSGANHRLQKIAEQYKKFVEKQNKGE